MARSTVQYEDIVKMNELYLTIKTYAGVARAVGFSPSTIKKYIVKDYKSIEKNKENEIKFNEEISPTPAQFPSNSHDLSLFFNLTEEERAGCEELRKEILL